MYCQVVDLASSDEEKEAEKDEIEGQRINAEAVRYREIASRLQKQSSKCGGIPIQNASLADEVNRLVREKKLKASVKIKNDNEKLEVSLSNSSSMTGGVLIVNSIDNGNKLLDSNPNSVSSGVLISKNCKSTSNKKKRSDLNPNFAVGSILTSQNGNSILNGKKRSNLNPNSAVGSVLISQNGNSILNGKKRSDLNPNSAVGSVLISQKGNSILNGKKRSDLNPNSAVGSVLISQKGNSILNGKKRSDLNPNSAVGSVLTSQNGNSILNGKKRSDLNLNSTTGSVLISKNGNSIINGMKLSDLNLFKNSQEEVKNQQKTCAIKGGKSLLSAQCNNINGNQIAGIRIRPQSELSKPIETPNANNVNPVHVNNSVEVKSSNLPNIKDASSTKTHKNKQYYKNKQIINSNVCTPFSKTVPAFRCDNKFPVMPIIVNTCSLSQFPKLYEQIVEQNDSITSSLLESSLLEPTRSIIEPVVNVKPSTVKIQSNGVKTSPKTVNNIVKIPTKVAKVLIKNGKRPIKILKTPPKAPETPPKAATEVIYLDDDEDCINKSRPPNVSEESESDNEADASNLQEECIDEEKCFGSDVIEEDPLEIGSDGSEKENSEPAIPSNSDEPVNKKPKLADEEKSVSTTDDREENISKTDEAFNELVNLCLSIENTDVMKKIIDKRLIQCYKFLDRDVKCSEQFRDLIQKKIDEMKKSPQYLFIYIKYFVDELKAFRSKSVKNEAGTSDDKKNEGDKFKNRIMDLEKAISRYKKKISKLEEAEVNYDDEENSAYILCDKYKERLLKAHKELCKLKNMSVGRRNHVYDVLSTVEINIGVSNFLKTIQEKARKRHWFPNFLETLEVIKKCAKEENLAFSPSELHSKARTAFLVIGDAIQKKRKQTEFQSLCEMMASSNDDPAEADPELAAALNRNIIYRKRVEDVIDKYADMECSPKERENIPDSSTNPETGSSAPSNIIKRVTPVTVPDSSTKSPPETRNDTAANSSGGLSQNILDDRSSKPLQNLDDDVILIE